MERIALRDEEMERVEMHGEMEESEKRRVLRAKRTRGIMDVREEVVVLIDTHSFNEFWKTKSSTVLKRVIDTRCNLHEPLQENLENAQLLSKDNEGHNGDSGEPPLRWEKKTRYQNED